MRRALRSTGAALVVAALGIPAASAGATVARSGAAVPVIDLALKAPAGYESGCCLKIHSGEWDAALPATTDTHGPSATSRIAWRTKIGIHAATVERAARALRSRTWPAIEAGVVFVPHIVAGKQVGTIPASYLLTRSTTTAASELLVGIGLQKRTYAGVRLRANDPGPTSAEPAATGVDRAASVAWNDARLHEALANIRLEGSLAPTTVTLGHSSTRRLRGVVRDTFDHPVAEARIELRRAEGSRWIRVGSASTSATGAFALRVPGAGTYRVTGMLNGAKALSRSRVIR